MNTQVLRDYQSATALSFARSVVAQACTACEWVPVLAASVQGTPPPVA